MKLKSKILLGLGIFAALCERTVRVAFDFFDIGKSEFHYAASSKSSG